MKKKIAKNKKGDINSKYLVGIILLVVAFAVVLLFYYAFDWTGQVDKQSCHNSVVIKGTIPTIANQKVVPVPLKCETEKLCITTNVLLNGNCDKDYMGEKYQTVRVSSSDYENEIKKIFADKMYECWWMMGQGKLQLYSRGWTSGAACNLCTRIAFDSNLKEQLTKKNINGLTNYLTSNNVPDGGKTYWQYLTNSESNYVYGNSQGNDNLNGNQQVIIFEEYMPGGWAKWSGEIGAVSAGAIVGAKIGFLVPLPGTTILGAGLGAFAGYLTSSAISEKWGTPSDKLVVSGIGLHDYNFQTLNKMSCSSFSG